MWTEFTSSNGSAYGLPTLPDGSFLDLPRSTNLSADWGRDSRKGRTAFAKLDQDLPGDWELRGALERLPLRGAAARRRSRRGRSTRRRLQLHRRGPARGLGQRHLQPRRLRHRPGAALRARARADGRPQRRPHRSALDRRPPAPPEPLQISHAFDHDPTTVPEEDRRRLADRVAGGRTRRSTQFGIYAGGRFSLSDPLHLIVGARASSYSYEDADASFDTQDIDALRGAHLRLQRLGHRLRQLRPHLPARTSGTRAPTAACSTRSRATTTRSA